MRKSLVICASAVLAAAACFTGCKLNESQISAIANQAGIASVALWIGVDNPSSDQKVVATEMVNVIKENASTVVAGASYYEVMSPMINTYIDSNVNEQYKLIARLAGGWVLNGVDMFFVMYPTYSTNATASAKIVGSFCDGAIIALAMASDDPIIKAASRGMADSAKARKALQ